MQSRQMLVVKQRHCALQKRKETIIRPGRYGGKQIRSEFCARPGRQRQILDERIGHDVFAGIADGTFRDRIDRALPEFFGSLCSLKREPSPFLHYDISNSQPLLNSIHCFLRDMMLCQCSSELLWTRHAVSSGFSLQKTGICLDNSCLLVCSAPYHHATG